ncbi:hypothetical protein [Archangium violaceum]|uniref:hypothetical protein n=1 Tax=Archangium violaceum TaxID=83451 RepID=UPI001F1C79C7|nr:hypothetical protein [Archangium violaceum]
MSSGDMPGVEPVIGHPISGLTDGFTSLALHALLVHQSLRDLIHYARLSTSESRFWRDTALILGISRARTLEQEELEVLLKEELVPLAVRRARLDIPREKQHVLPRGHASVLTALSDVSKSIAAGQFQRALIVGVDSLVSQPLVEHFFQEGRLKTPEHPIGLMPGEAAAALLVEEERAAQRRGARIEAFIGALSLGTETVLERGSACQGLQLAATIERTLAQATHIGDIYGDLNGEERRAREWGTFLARLPRESLLSHTASHWPAVSFGDTGAASGAISIAAAARSFARNYARSSESLVWSRAESGEVASGLVIRP